MDGKYKDSHRVSIDDVIKHPEIAQSFDTKQVKQIMNKPDFKDSEYGLDFVTDHPEFDIDNETSSILTLQIIILILLI